MQTTSAHRWQAAKDTLRDQASGMFVKGPFYGSVLAAAFQAIHGLTGGSVGAAEFGTIFAGTYSAYMAMHIYKRAHYTLQRANGGNDPALNDLLGKVRQLYVDGAIADTRDDGVWIVEKPDDSQVWIMQPAEFQNFAAECERRGDPLVTLHVADDQAQAKVWQNGQLHSDRGPALIHLDRTTNEITSHYFRNGHEIDPVDFEPTESVSHGSVFNPV